VNQTKSTKHSAVPKARLRRSAPEPTDYPRDSIKPMVDVSPGSAPASTLPFSVVGIGASAGGFEAFSVFISHLPVDTGLAFVFVQHLDPKHDSMLTDLLSRVGRVLVKEIEDNMAVEPNAIYVLPQNAGVVLEKGRLRLTPRAPSPSPMPIDIFFRSLAKEQQNRAIGVVLSGTGTDGALGATEIKGQGGITFAQDKGTAKHFGMPSSAINEGAIDFVLPPDGIAEEIGRLARHPYVAAEVKGGAQKRRMAAMPPLPEAEDLFKKNPQELRQLFGLLRTRTGVDFSLYKPGTLNRRIMRRMVLHKADDLAAYLHYLGKDPAELDGLFNDLLISVTGFFRDPALFQALQEDILPKLLQNRAKDMPLRLWSCGCATGEEAYSLAMLVSEALEARRQDVPVQIFASDLNERGIEKARAGVYHENILLDVSPERLRRFFTKVNSHYQVKQVLRDKCVFARQNVVTDPPFSNLDVVTCRNVLIYLTPVLQRRVFPTFHYALRPGGYLLLGNSENVGEHSDLFDLWDKKNRIYIKKTTAYRPAVQFQPRPGPHLGAPVAAAGSPSKVELAGNIQHGVDRFILAKFSPPGVVINAQMDVLQFRGRLGPYLEPQPGAASLNLFKMIRSDLVTDVRRAVAKALKTDGHVLHRGAGMPVNGARKRIDLEVYPLDGTLDRDRLFLLLFHDKTSAHETAPRNASKAAAQTSELRQVRRLREELTHTRQSLQAIIEEHEIHNEELKSANEEIQSANEELQSTNEELETAREELQSANEELTTLNQEAQNRNSELSLVNDDLTNLLSSVNIPILMLSTDLKIRRFTPLAEKLFNLIASDVGRRLSDLAGNIQFPGLDEMIHGVLENLTVAERQVQDREGHWFTLRIRPYRTRDGRIEGLVLMLLDIDTFKRALQQSVGLIWHPMLALQSDLTVDCANNLFCQEFNAQENQIEGQSIFEIADRQWDFPRFRQLLEEILPSQAEVQDFRIEHEFAGLRRRKLIVNARRFHDATRGVLLILLAIREET
jgi:two-component system, chemotaxis family, CheB/CheR fusion protein